MATINLYLLQTPLILLDGNAVTLPFKKAEALLYYLAIKKNISREQAATLLWDSNDDQTARKNLRHTLYTIKKAFDLDLIISPQKQLLSLNTDITFNIDYDNFIKNGNLDLYQGDLLQGFSVKNADAFEEWLETERTILKDTYLRSLYNLMIKVTNDNLSSVEKLFLKYIKEDPLDERVYLIMMQCYQKNHLYHKGIKVYQNLSKLLNSELRIAPSHEIVQLHRELLNAWMESSSSEPESERIIGRSKEMKYLMNTYHSFLSGSPSAVFLAGDNGVGKTYLMNSFLDELENDSCIILRSICFQAERDFIFQPWNSIMLQLDRYMNTNNIYVPTNYLTNISNLFPLFGSQNLMTHVPEDVMTSYNYRATRNSILKLFSLIGEENPIILSFDNIQFMDSLSLELLSLIIRERNPNIMIIGTCLDVLPPRIQHYINSLVKEKFLNQLIIEPFNKQDVYEIIISRLGEDSINSQILDNIYSETEGNAFFLDMVLNFFSNGKTGKNIFSLHPQDILSDRITELSTDSRQVLDIISICHDYSTLDIVEYILNRDTLEIIDLIDNLKQHGLIEEKVIDNQIRFQFRHNKMREFVHSQLSPSKRRLLHARVAAYIEHNVTIHNNNWYQNLIYHYTLSGNEAKVLQYKILNLEDYSRCNFELYPILQPQKDSALEAPKQINEYFDELTSELIRLYHYQPNAIDFAELEARLYLLINKYYIYQGEYKNGVSSINQILKSNTYIPEHPDFYIAYLRQLTFYGIQTWNTNLMKENIQKSMKIASENHLNTEYAIECRLYGLYLSMCGNYQESKTYLNKAINLLQSTSLKGQSYGLNIAACYNYLGEVERKQENFEKSLDFYNRAIHTCEKRKCPQNPTFYSNKSRALFALERYQEASMVLITANQLYDNSSTLVGRAITKANYSILQASHGNMESAISLLKDAIISSKTINSPMSLGIVARTKAILIKNFENTFKNIITESFEECCQEIKKYLEGIPGAYELNNPVELPALSDITY